MHVAVVSFTSIAADHRVLRTIAALEAHGYDVTAIGFGEKPDAPCAFVQLPSIGTRTAHRLTVAATHAPANLLPAASTTLHFAWPQHRAARRALLALRPDIVHANDVSSLPAADAARRACGSLIVYDSHEFATEEHLGNPRWRLVARRHVVELERRHIGAAVRVITVSDGIADALQSLYGLPERPAVVRNTPTYQTVAPRPANRPVQLLFHGILKPERGIEEAIQAMVRLPEHVLTLRGSGAPDYLADLRGMATRLGLDRRVSVTPPVPAGEVIASAARHDIGVFCPPTDSRQIRFALPNKVFEYIMAGLAVVVCEGTDLATLVARHACGSAAASADPAAIAQAVASLDGERLERARGAALAAARELCWENERRRLLDVYDALPANAERRGPAAARAAPASPAPNLEGH